MTSSRVNIDSAKKFLTMFVDLLREVTDTLNVQCLTQNEESNDEIVANDFVVTSKIKKHLFNIIDILEKTVRSEQEQEIKKAVFFLTQLDGYENKDSEKMLLDIMHVAVNFVFYEETKNKKNQVAH